VGSDPTLPAPRRPLGGMVGITGMLTFT